MEDIVYEMHDFIEDRCDLDTEFFRVAKLALDALLSEGQRINAVMLGDCLDTALEYWNNNSSEDELSRAKIIAWESIKSRSAEFSDPEVCLVRLLLCTLYGKHLEKRDIPQDGLLWFVLYLAIEANISCELLILLLNKYFGAELKSRPTNKVKNENAASGTDAQKAARLF